MFGGILHNPRYSVEIRTTAAKGKIDWSPSHPSRQYYEEQHYEEKSGWTPTRLFPGSTNPYNSTIEAVHRYTIPSNRVQISIGPTQPLFRGLAGDSA